VHEKNAVRFGIPQDIWTYHFRPVLGSTSIPIQSVLGDFIMGIKRYEREAEHFSQFTAEFKVTWIITSDLPQFVSSCVQLNKIMKTCMNYYYYQNN
jgi:hypothetical protein